MRQGFFHRLLAGAYLAGGAAVLVIAIIDGRAEADPAFDVQMGLFGRYVAAGALLYLGLELARTSLRGILLGVLLLLFSLIVHVAHLAIFGAPNWAALAAHAAAYVVALGYVRTDAFVRRVASVK